MDIKVGISTACLYPMLTEDALFKLIMLKCDNFEIFVNSAEDLCGQNLKKMETMLKENQRSVVSVHPYSSEFETTLFFTDYERRFHEGLDIYKKYFEFACRLGAKYVIFHGSRDKSVSNEFYCENLYRLARTAKKSGVELLQENVERCKSGEIQLIQYIHNNLPDIGFTYDIKQEKRSGLKDMEMLKAMGNSVRHIHVSDHDVINECLPICQGDYDYSVLVRYLSAIRYNGSMIIELYSDVCFDKNIRLSVDCLREIIVKNNDANI